jgi:hypothetical protein
MEHGETWRIVAPEALKDSGTRSLYTATQKQCHIFPPKNANDPLHFQMVTHIEKLRCPTFVGLNSFRTMT